MIGEWGNEESANYMQAFALFLSFNSTFFFTHFMWYGVDDFFLSCSVAIRYGNEADETDSSGEEDGEEGRTQFSTFLFIVNWSGWNSVKTNWNCPFVSTILIFWSIFNVRDHFRSFGASCCLKYARSQWRRIEWKSLLQRLVERFEWFFIERKEDLGFVLKS